MERPTINGIPHEEPSANKSWFDWFRLVVGLLVAALGVRVVSTENRAFDIRRDWTSVAAIFMFAFIALKSWLERCDSEKKKTNLVRVLYWTIAIPVVLATLVSHAQQLVSAYRWLGPGLSVVAIVLVVVLGILFKD